MITLEYLFRSTLEARIFAFKIRNERCGRYGGKQHRLRYPHTKVFRTDRRVTVTHDEKKLPGFVEVYGKPDYRTKVSYEKDITQTAERFHGYRAA